MELSKKYNKTPAQIVLRWAIDRNTIVIPKSATFERQKENMQIVDFKMDKEDIDAIATLNENIRICYKKPFIAGDTDIFA